MASLRRFGSVPTSPRSLVKALFVCEKNLGPATLKFQSTDRFNSDKNRHATRCIKKTLTGPKPIEIIGHPTNCRLITMKLLLSFCIGIVTCLLILDRFVIFAETFTEGVRVSPETVTLKPGEYVWEPERAPEGPLLIVASTTEQVAYVYRNGIRIARSSVSTGRPGHRTPTGVFTILEKEVHHTSSIYKGAEMPYMERVTWGGIALHAGNLPGYPDSHGCVRLPLEFSKLLFGVTMKGATVIIADEHSAPAETV